MASEALGLLPIEPRRTRRQKSEEEEKSGIAVISLWLFFVIFVASW